MSKRQRRDETTVSLFPFLSILACVIGVLTLLITALALGQMDRQQSPEVVDRAQQAEQLQQQISEDESKLAAMQERLDEVESVREELARAIEELKNLQEELARKQQQAEQNEELKIKLLAEADELRKRIAELEAEIERLKKEIVTLQAQLNERLNPEDSEVQIRPGGTGLDLNPSFVECTAEGIVVHEGKTPDFIPTAQMGDPDKKFVQLLVRVAQQPKGIVIFLIRDDALSTFDRASKMARFVRTPHGKLPVIGHGELDLSIFK